MNFYFWKFFSLWLALTSSVLCNLSFSSVCSTFQTTTYAHTYQQVTLDLSMYRKYGYTFLVRKLLYCSRVVLYCTHVSCSVLTCSVSPGSKHNDEDEKEDRQNHHHGYPGGDTPDPCRPPSTIPALPGGPVSGYRIPWHCAWCLGKLVGHWPRRDVFTSPKSSLWSSYSVISVHEKISGSTRKWVSIHEK